MKGLLRGWAVGALLAASVACCGCNGQSTVPFDPFLGPSRVPPPGTGTATGTAPYYPQPAPVAPGTALPPGSTLPPAGTSLPGHLQGAAPTTTLGEVATSSSNAATSPVVPATHESSLPSGSGGASASTAERSVVRIVEPTTSAASTASTSGLTKQLSDAPAALAEPRRLVLSEEPKEITELPKAAEWTPIGGGSTTTTTTAHRPITTSGTTATPALDGSYDHDSAYRWLQGRLEYSQVAEQYKLRYIPIDGQTDRYGGSVVLPDAPELAQFAHGQFVRVEGSMGTSDAAGADFAPIYNATRIKAVTR